MALQDLPAQAQPRGSPRRLALGAFDIELLAIVLRTGMAGKGVLQLAQGCCGCPACPCRPGTPT